MIVDSTIGNPKSLLDTPCLVIDRHLLRENIALMQREMKQAQKILRPHAKTHKCVDIAKLQIEAGASGISVAKVSEALVLAEYGFKNTLITSPVVTPTKIATLMLCLHGDPNVTVVVDNLENARALDAAAREKNAVLNILIDLDPHLGRTGIPYEEAVQFARQVQSYSNLELKGVQCYSGNLQHITDYDARATATLEELNHAVKTIWALREAGVPCEIFSTSGTGTYDIDKTIPEITEVQPGSYTVMDAEYYLLGSAENPQRNQKFKTAMTLLTTVISVHHDKSVTCDAGWKALYESPVKPIVLRPEGYEYDWFGDEHGRITSASGKALPVLGERLEIMVGHCDPTINLYDFFYVIENDFVVDIWPINMRGKSQ